MVLARTSRRIWLVGAASAALWSCATPPDLGPRPELTSPAQLESAQSFSSAPTQWPSDSWWIDYGDPQLNALIEEALEDAPSLAAAAARVARAQADAQQSGAARLPSVSAQTQIETSQQDFSADNLPDVIRNAVPSDWSTRTNAAVTLQYQLDFFGRNRATFAAATSRAQAAEAEAAAARLQLSTAVALAYAEFVRLHAERAALEDALAVREASVELVAQRVIRGLENEGQASQAASERAQARADIVAADAAIARTRNQLAALLGKGPDRGLAIAAPNGFALNPVGLPTQIELDLIGRRPDLVAARLGAESAAHRIDAARADFYPNINLVAIAGLQTLGLDRLGGGDVRFAQAGPAISLPIFSGGRIEGAYRGARADYDEAVAQYNQALADALREVADALGDRRALEAQRDEQRGALAHAENAYRIARLRYQGGLVSYIDTLSAESNVIAQRRAVADLEARALSLDITLIRALGGGYGTS
ncbi:MAG: efflux transporter outer membrane subunit [Alphaproteobacteria bacterium]|nr:efflux transporter outer membrane subunit [Alphaproteobacteria bacterium]